MKHTGVLDHRNGMAGKLMTPAPYSIKKESILCIIELYYGYFLNFDKYSMVRYVIMSTWELSILFL